MVIIVMVLKNHPEEERYGRHENFRLKYLKYSCNIHKTNSCNPLLKPRPGTIQVIWRSDEKQTKEDTRN